MNTTPDLGARADLAAAPGLYPSHAAPDQPDPSLEEGLGRTAQARRIALALSLLIGPWLIATSDALSSWSMRNGADDLTPSGALAVAAAHPTLERWAGLTGLLGCLLVVPASIGLMRLVRVRAARLGWVAGVMMCAAYICYFALVFQGFTPGAMVRTGGSTSNHEAILQALLEEPMLIWVPIVFVLGNIVGTFLMGLALLRAHCVPRWAGYAVLGWPVLHVVGLPWCEVVGSVLQALGMAAAAVVLLDLSTTHPAEPAAPYELLRK